jgi:hypothetical protein
MGDASQCKLHLMPVLVEKRYQEDKSQGKYNKYTRLMELKKLNIQQHNIIFYLFLI